jgi:uncharacterized protein YndB with AHSA1/START domain
MLKRIVLALAVLLLALVAFVALQPSAYRIARSAAIAAPPQVVYEQIADFRRWAAWSPWAKLDPAMAVDYGGPPLGVGATYHWKGNDKVGEGRMTVVDARPGELVAIQLDFIKPWESRTRTEFRLGPEAGGTRVSWAMSGENDFVGKAFATFVSMDKAIGPDFEKGLAALRAVAEEESVRAQRAAPPPRGPPGTAPAPPR